VLLAKILSSTNAFEISNFQETETEGPLTSGDQYVTTLHYVENRWMEFFDPQPVSLSDGSRTESGKHSSAISSMWFLL
jgi:hypothetical protein